MNDLKELTLSRWLPILQASLTLLSHFLPPLFVFPLFCRYFRSQWDASGEEAALVRVREATQKRSYWMCAGYVAQASFLSFLLLLALCTAAVDSRNPCTPWPLSVCTHTRKVRTSWYSILTETTHTTTFGWVSLSVHESETLLCVDSSEFWPGIFTLRLVLRWWFWWRQQC